MGSASPRRNQSPSAVGETGASRGGTSHRHSESSRSTSRWSTRNHCSIGVPLRKATFHYFTNGGRQCPISRETGHVVFGQFHLSGLRVNQDLPVNTPRENHGWGRASRLSPAFLSCYFPISTRFSVHP